MAKRVRIVWEKRAMRSLRTMDEVVDLIDDRADEMAAQAGHGYVARSNISGGRGRARAVVITGNLDAVRDNARNNTLVRVLGGRGALVRYVSKAGKVSWVTEKQRDNYMRSRKG